MPKKRTYSAIGAFDNGGGIDIHHLIGEVSVPSPGAYILDIPCGCGKSTAIKDLVSKKHDCGIIIFVATKKDADVMKADLDALAISTLTDEVIVLHQDSTSHKSFMDHPEMFTQKKVLIVPHVHLYIGFLPALLAFGKKVDLDKYVGDLKSLMCSSEVREFIIIDEQPSFICPYKEIRRSEMLGYMSDVKKTSGTVKTVCRSMTDMNHIYDTFIRNSKDSFYKQDSALNRLRVKENLNHIRSEYDEMRNSKSAFHQFFHFLKDIPRKKMKSYLLLFDATASVLSNYKKTAFNLLSDPSSLYSSPITFESFQMNLERWLFDGKVGDAELRIQLADIVDELEQQINTATPLLIITWKYMVSRDHDPDIEDKKVDMIRVLEEMLNERGLAGKFSIIYRGSGEDKATNSFADYAGVSFLGEWKTGKSSLKLLNKNYGIKATEMKLRLAAMVQAVCRIRIRRHDGNPIWIFYSDDIDKQLMSELYGYFRKNSVPGTAISGMPVYVKNTRPDRFIEKVKALCDYDSGLFNAIKNCSPYTVNITLKDIQAIIPMKEKRSRSYAPLIKDMLKEYEITLNVR